MSYDKELHIALLAVQRATLLTQHVFHEKEKGTSSKEDKSPVTIGDYGAQALVIHAIRKNFPEDEIVAEEDSVSLREQRPVVDQIWGLVKETKLNDQKAEEELGGPIGDVEAMLTAIDAGSSPGGSKGRIWVLDPIDGTKGFLRGGQYAIALALIENGNVKVGVLGCPNFPVSDSAPLSAYVGKQGINDNDGRGILFSAVIGAGATIRPLSHGGLQTSQTIHMKEITDITQATICEGVEAGHSSHSDQAQIATKLGITNPSVRMDSQAKYGSVARGAGDVYLRVPVSASYVEKIWDHAAGYLIVSEAGGEVTDIEGNQLDFARGRTLTANKGVMAAPKGIYKRVLEVVRSVLNPN